MFEIAVVNEPSVFEPLKFDCTVSKTNINLLKVNGDLLFKRSHYVIFTFASTLNVG